MAKTEADDATGAAKTARWAPCLDSFIGSIGVSNIILNVTGDSCSDKLIVADGERGARTK